MVFSNYSLPEMACFMEKSSVARAEKKNIAQFSLKIAQKVASND
jgi:hypothetical protein